MLQQRTTASLSRGQGVWRKTTPPASSFDNAVLRGLPVDKEIQNTVRPRVVGACYSRIAPTPIENPQLVIAAPDALRLVGIQVYRDDNDAHTDHVPNDELTTMDALVPYLAGNALFDGSETAAQCYCGHQFGYFSGQLGDGAAVYLGEIVSGSGEAAQRWEMQLKGAGKTPFSRTADGRKVLRSTLREFLASEHMHALGIPTTRAGSVVVSHDTTVVRDVFYDGNAKHEPTAVVLRIAQSFLRFGSFEIFKETDADTGRAGPSAHLPYKRAMLRQMLDFSIRQYFPAIERLELERGAAYVKLMEEVVRRTAVLVAQWQSVGFCHGVLNTDNMSLVGDTLDYGPFGFMEHFNPEHICNTSDDSGRYRYDAQPSICKWNCAVLADQLALVLDRTLLEPALDTFDEIYEAEYYRRMRAKLGLLHKHFDDDDRALVDALVDVLTATGADFTCTFRALVDVKAFGKTAMHAAVVTDLVQFSETLQQRKRRLTKFTEAQYQSVALLLRTSPEQARMYGVSPALFDQMTRERETLQAFDKRSEAEHHAELRHVWTAWIERYATRLQAETDGVPDAAHELHRRDKMNRVNPKYVLRNHVAQQAIEYATNGAYDHVQHILKLLTHPFDDGDACDRVYAWPQAPEAPPLCVSCSS